MLVSANRLKWNNLINTWIKNFIKGGRSWNKRWKNPWASCYHSSWYSACSPSCRSRRARQVMLISPISCLYHHRVLQRGITYNNHFYKIEWTGINTQSTSEVQLLEYKNVRVHWTGSNGESTSVVQDVFAVSKRGTTDSTFLLRDATLHALWNPLEVENLTAGQSSSGYTSSDVLAAGANNKN